MLASSHTVNDSAVPQALVHKDSAYPHHPRSRQQSSYYYASQSRAMMVYRTNNCTAAANVPSIVHKTSHNREPVLAIDRKSLLRRGSLSLGRCFHRALRDECCRFGCQPSSKGRTGPWCIAPRSYAALAAHFDVQWRLLESPDL